MFAADAAALSALYCSVLSAPNRAPPFAADWPVLSAGDWPALFAASWSALLDMAAAVCNVWPVTGSVVPAPQALSRTAAPQHSSALTRIVEANVRNFFI
jgi:hypothetical protein